MTTCASVLRPSSRSDQRECERETGHWDVEIVVDARVVVGANLMMMPVLVLMILPSVGDYSSIALFISEVFRRMDKNGDGHLDFDELHEALV